jgi:hypothetical protein
MKLLFIFLFSSLVFNQSNIEYKISIWGIPAAKCTYSLSDTTIYDIPSLKIDYYVETTGLYNLFFPIKNNYSVIFNKKTYEILSYYKNSYQPNVENKIKTIFKDNIVSYESGIKINKEEINIFILLYLLSNNKLNIIENFPIIDREGKKYKYELKQLKNKSYAINLIQVDDTKVGIIKDTDIFTWGLFLPKTENIIYIDDELLLINKCVFKKGFIKLVAKRMK